MMYKVVSPEWSGITIENGFKTYKAAYMWALYNCGESSCWGGIWEIQTYPNPDKWIMKI